MTAREHFGDPQMERLQIRIRNLEALVARCPFISGSLVEGISLTTSSLTIAHRLGRVPKGVIVVSVSPDAAIGLSASQPNEPHILSNVEASATCTADLWFW